MTLLPVHESDEARLAQALERAERSSAFFSRSLVSMASLAPGPATPPREAMLGLARSPWTAARVGAHVDACIEAILGAGTAATEAGVAQALRRARRELLCSLLLRDAASLAPLEEVTAAMTAFAEVAVTRLLRVLAPALAAERGLPVDPDGEPQDLLVVAMGKAGSGELNVSSDLDLVFAYAEEGSTRPATGASRGPVDNQEFFGRLGRALIAALSAHGEEGFVFRIDMRLRPHGDSGPIAVSLPMLEEYLVREGREWERFAWAKARVIDAPVLSDPAQFARQRASLKAAVHPFVWRKYLDFGAFAALRDLHRRIGEARDRRSLARPGARIDVKLGRGGIRELEFLVQSFAIVRGGREPDLRERGTIAGLRRLAARGLIARADAQRLEEAYRLLRRIEHALQWREDAQTHEFDPGGPSGAAAALLLGYETPARLLEALEGAREDVARAFDEMLDAPVPAAAAPGGEPPSEEELAGLGFEDARAAAQRLRDLVEAPRWREAAPGTRDTVARLARSAVAAIGGGAHAHEGVAHASADELLLRWIRFVESIGRRATYLSLLAEFAPAHARVLQVLDAGGWAAEYLRRHPVVLDELLDRGGDGPEREGAGPEAAAARWRAWGGELAGHLEVFPGDVERQMNLLRDAHHAQVFRLLLRDLRGELPVEALADELSGLADAVLALVMRFAWLALGDPAPPPALAILAYGKLGGRELGYASDLDLAFVHGGADGVEGAEEGARSMRWVRQILSWLSTTTSSGTLFEIDLRLRPDGNAGLLVTPIESFERYQRNEDGHGAWVWEHQALTRARACAGDARLGARVERLRREVLARPREAAALAAEVLAMRARMLAGHPNRDPRFDLKHDRGGMVDVEFAVQFLVLAHAHAHEELLANAGTLALLGRAGRLGLVDAGLADRAASAYRRFRILQHELRRNGATRALVDPSLVAGETAGVLALWRHVFGTGEPLRIPAAGATGGVASG